jgi:hypothetical protein
MLAHVTTHGTDDAGLPKFPSPIFKVCFSRSVRDDKREKPGAYWFDLIEAVTDQARAELGDLDVAIAHIDQMLAITSSVRDLPDARIEAILDWIEAEMLDHSFAWRERRLILFTEWDDMRAELGSQTGSLSSSTPRPLAAKAPWVG